MSPNVRTLLLASLITGSLTARVAAQVQVVEEHEVEVVEQGDVSAPPVVEQGYVRGVGRGIQYGAHIISPIYLTAVLARDVAAVPVDAGVGVHGRVGWEFPSGFTLEVFGGFAGSGVDNTLGLEMSSVFMRGDLGVGARYMFFNETAFVPFVEVGGGLRWFFFDWVDTTGSVQSSGDGETMTGAVHGAVGAQIELSPYFGIEAGCAVDYTFAGPVFADGVVSIMPFLGVTLYVYDESGN